MKMKKGKNLFIRKPDNVSIRDILLWKNDEISRPVGEKSGYIFLGYIPKGTKIIMEFPLLTYITKEKIMEKVFNLVWTGNTLVDIFPPGKYGPLYTNRKESLR